MHKLECGRNAEGNKLAYLTPLDENGEEKCGYRIAGPKPWGNFSEMFTINISDDDLTRYVLQYAPEVVKRIREEK